MKVYKQPSLQTYSFPSISSVTSLSIPSCLRWREQLQRVIEEIAKTDPKKAKQISLISISYRGTRDERAQLKDLGVEMPVQLSRGRLLGGMMGGVEALGVVVWVAKGAIEFLVNGNMKDMKDLNKETFINANIKLGDKIIEGYHEGKRVLSDPKGFIKPKYTLIATGMGKFTSMEVNYEGEFFNNLFHDSSGKAVLRIGNNVRYTGQFYQGKRNGQGTLELYDEDKADFYIYFTGTWEEDSPKTSTYYSGDTTRSNLVNINHSVARSMVPDPPPNAKISSNPLPPSPPIFHQSPLKSSSGSIAPSIKSLLERKLVDPHTPLSIEEGIALLSYCLEQGERQLSKITNRAAIFVIGPTGAGKSTFINYLAGCTMELRSPSELGLTDLSSVVVVRDRSRGGPLDPLTGVGHGKLSATFMPDIQTDLSGITYCDCPGFFDNRGEEINIANAVNIRNALDKSESAKLIILVNYHSLKGDRARGLNDLIRACINLFGSEDTLKNYSSSLWFGISHAPLDCELSNLRAWLQQGTSSIISYLSHRFFLYDPLERPMEGRWTRHEILENIYNLTPLRAENIFKTVLSDTDEKRLLEIGEKIGNQINRCFNNKDFLNAVFHLKKLDTINSLQHPIVDRLITQNRLKVLQYLQKSIDDFRYHCNFDHFEDADKIMLEVIEVHTLFAWAIDDMFHLPDMQQYYLEAQSRYYERLEREKEHERQLEEAKDEITTLLASLAEQKRSTEVEIERLKNDNIAFQNDLEKRFTSIQNAYGEVKKKLNAERKVRLLEREKELDLRHALNEQIASNSNQTNKKHDDEKQRLKVELEKEYDLKLEKEKMQRALLEQTLQKQQQVYHETLLQQQSKLSERLEAIENQSSSQRRALERNKASIADFGKHEWNSYFGSVDSVPTLPSEIYELLKSPCPYWGDKGKKVKDTHLLVLIPKRVKNKSLTLNRLQKLTNESKAGGRNIAFGYYGDDIQEAKGEEKLIQSYWILITKDVVPGSKGKLPDEGKDLVENKGYRLPSLLEASAAFMLHYLKTGERLCGDNPTQHTLCRGKVKGCHLSFGDFSSDGPSLHDFYENDNRKSSYGCCAVRQYPEF